MEVARANFIRLHLPNVDVEAALSCIASMSEIEQLGELIYSLVEEQILPFFQQKLILWKDADRHLLGREMPNLILALAQFITVIDEAYQNALSAVDAFNDASASTMTLSGGTFNDDGIVCKMFVQLIFSKPFLERFQAPCIRVLKYHFVLCHGEKYNLIEERNALAYNGRIKEMLLTLYSIDFLREYMRSCATLSIAHIISNIVRQSTDKTSVRIEQIKITSYNEKCNFVLQWLKKLPIELPNIEEDFTNYAQRTLIMHLCTCFPYEIFIQHYPKTQELVKELRTLMKKQNWYGREALLKHFCAAVEKSLLHIGVNTNEILTAYARVVESLILFDESFVLVHKVCDLIKKYAKTRSDTVRRIIQYITAEKPGEFSNNIIQLVDRENLVNVNDEYVLLAEDAHNNRWNSWQPDPYDANPTESRLYRESADVFNMLVSIYDCKDLFVKEYQCQLANNLISNGWGKQMDSEAKYLEKMKRRFSENELNQCEVMLKDIRDSSRLYGIAVHEGMHVPFLPQIVSHVFWPELKRDVKMDLVVPLCDYVDEYTLIYQKKRPTRTIRWYRDYGSCVKMDVWLGDCCYDVVVPLSYAQTLMPFLQESSITLEKLKATLNADRSTLLKRLEWWKSKGLLIDSADISDEKTWSLATPNAQRPPTTAATRQALCVDEKQDSDEEEEAEVPVEEQADALEQYWLYTKNLLLYHNTKDPLTPAKLASMYKMFASPGKPPPTVEAVLMFMQRKIKQNLVVFENGAYRPDKDLKSVFTA